MLMLFARTLDDRLASLARSANQMVADNADKRMAAFVVLLAENNAANQQKLRDLADKEKIAIPLTIALEGTKGPGAYKLDPKADVTALASRRKKVQANIVLTQPAPADEAACKAQVDQIIAAAKKLLD